MWRCQTFYFKTNTWYYCQLLPISSVSLSELYSFEPSCAHVFLLLQTSAGQQLTKWSSQIAKVCSVDWIGMFKHWCSNIFQNQTVVEYKAPDVCTKLWCSVMYSIQYVYVIVCIILSLYTRMWSLSISETKFLISTASVGIWNYILDWSNYQSKTRLLANPWCPCYYCKKCFQFLKPILLVHFY